MYICLYVNYDGCTHNVWYRVLLFTIVKSVYGYNINA